MREIRNRFSLNLFVFLDSSLWKIRQSSIENGGILCRTGLLQFFRLRSGRSGLKEGSETAVCMLYLYSRTLK